MSASTEALTLPGRGPRAALRGLTRIVLVLAISLSAIGVLATARDREAPTRAPMMTQDGPTHGRHPGTAPAGAAEDLMTHGRHP